MLGMYTTAVTVFGGLNAGLKVLRGIGVAIGDVLDGEFKKAGHTALSAVASPVTDCIATASLLIGDLCEGVQGLEARLQAAEDRRKARKAQAGHVDAVGTRQPPAEENERLKRELNKKEAALAILEAQMEARLKALEEADAEEQARKAEAEDKAKKDKGRKQGANGQAAAA